jgi:hypothetical protein
MQTSKIPTTKVDELETQLEDLDLEHAMSYSLADAMREGCRVSRQYVGGWVSEEGEKMCALSAAATAVKARHLLER